MGAVTPTILNKGQAMDSEYELVSIAERGGVTMGVVFQHRFREASAEVLRLIDGGTRWCFSPDVPWREGTYELVVRGTLEDAAGNRLGGRFETPVELPSGNPADAVVPFTVHARHERVATTLTAR